MATENEQRPAEAGKTPFASLVAGLKLKRPSALSLSTPRTRQGENSREPGTVTLKLRNLTDSMEGWADSILQGSTSADNKTTVEVSEADMNSPRHSSDESNANYSTRPEASNGSPITTTSSTPSVARRPRSMAIQSRRSLDPRHSAEWKLREAEIRGLRAELESTKKVLSASQQERDQLKSDLKQKEELLTSTKQDLEVARRAQEKQKAEISKAKEELEAKTAELKACQDELTREEQKVSLGTRLTRNGLVQTPRALVMMLVAHRTAGQTGNVEKDVDPTSLLRHQDLDKKISESQADGLLTHLEESNVVQEILDSAEITQCESCSQLKFDFREESEGNRQKIHPLHEYPKFITRFQPESTNICYPCRLRSITLNFEKHVWQVYGDDDFLAKIKHAGDLARVLHTLGDPDLERHVKLYERCALLRQALAVDRPNPLSRAALEASYELHLRLIRGGQMTSFLDDCYKDLEPDDESRVSPCRVGAVRFVEVQYRHRTVEIPLLMRFFKMVEEVVECAVCCESYLDIDLGTHENWERTYLPDFDNNWTSDLLKFPSPAIITGCDHKFDICKPCVAQHIVTQLEVHGRPGCERIGCPTLDCGRTYDFNDIQLLAPRETFALYDHYRLLNSISQEPTFMWCLGQGCGSGQLYTHASREVKCEVCGFRMCFRHQCSWHEGMTCEEFTKKRDFGTAGVDGETQDWMMGNSKRCPECRVAIEKNEGCNHMSCTNCRHEFCWLCLLDWRRHENCE